MDFLTLNVTLINLSRIQAIRFRQKINLMIDICEEEQKIFYKNNFHCSQDCLCLLKTERKKTFALKKISAFGVLKISLECQSLTSALLLPSKAATPSLMLFYGRN